MNITFQDVTSIFLNQAFAHETLYPHLHPHAGSNLAMDLLLTLFWLGGIGLLAFLLIQTTRKVIQKTSRK
jgi:hypothetical protein